MTTDRAKHDAHPIEVHSNLVQCRRCKEVATKGIIHDTECPALLRQLLDKAKDEIRELNRLIDDAAKGPNQP